MYVVINSKNFFDSDEAYLLGTLLWNWEIKSSSGNEARRYPELLHKGLCIYKIV
jgi:hypothetical protein